MRDAIDTLRDLRYSRHMSANIKLESRFPIPEPPVRYPFGRMRKGTSFSQPVDQIASVKSAASRYKRDHPGWDYRTTVQDRVIRLWCIAVPKQEGTAE
jgi:hypothetical protein